MCRGPAFLRKMRQSNTLKTQIWSIDEWLDIVNICNIRPINHVGQIRLHPDIERSALSLLSNLRPQCCDKVCRHSSPSHLSRQLPTQSLPTKSPQYRSFITRAYPTMKKNNPHTPIMIREALGTEPRVFTRYGMSPSSENLMITDAGNTLLISSLAG